MKLIADMRQLCHAFCAGKHNSLVFFELSSFSSNLFCFLGVVQEA